MRLTEVKIKVVVGCVFFLPLIVNDRQEQVVMEGMTCSEKARLGSNPGRCLRVLSTPQKVVFAVRAIFINLTFEKKNFDSRGEMQLTSLSNSLNPPEISIMITLKWNIIQPNLLDQMVSTRCDFSTFCATSITPSSVSLCPACFVWSSLSASIEAKPSPSLVHPFMQTSFIHKVANNLLTLTLSTSS